MSKGKGKRASGSRSRTQSGKRVREGTKRKSKTRQLQCSVCGRWFSTLGEVNSHYSAAGHQRKRRPPKRFKIDSSKFDQKDIDMALGLLELLKNPRRMKERIREQLLKKSRRRDLYYGR